MLRIGECNSCGLCCGANRPAGDEHLQRPSFSFAIRNVATQELLYEEFPLAELVGCPTHSQIEANPNGWSGLAKIKNKTFKFAWIPKIGLVKGDLDNWSAECPFLLEDPGNGTRPCALHKEAGGTNTTHNAWLKLCSNVPPEKTQQEVDEWRYFHPMCSYNWG